MHDTTVNNITTGVQATWSATRDRRLKELLIQLVPHLHAYVREVKLTHAEWLAGLDFLFKAGAISNDTRNEFSLISDVLGITSLVDLQNATPGATVGSVLGPFYVENSPEIPLGGDLVKDNAGEVVLLEGAVHGVDGQPVPGASIDMWQTDSRGQYAAHDKTQHPDNLRCKQSCDHAGRYWLTTVLPAPYSIPMDGPVGALFRLTGRSQWRPAHYHFIVRAPGYRPIVPEVFLAGDTYVDRDAVFGVRQPLVVPVEPVGPGTRLPTPLSRQPAKVVRFDFRLVWEGT